MDLTANVNKPDNAVITDMSIILITVDKRTPITPTIDSNIPTKDSIFLFTTPHAWINRSTINILLKTVRQCHINHEKLKKTKLLKQRSKCI